MLDEALGDLAASVQLVRVSTTTRRPRRRSTHRCGTRSTADDRSVLRGQRTVPFMTVGATDARFFRRAGIDVVRLRPVQPNITFEDYGAMFHGDDERVDVESLRLSPSCGTPSPATSSSAE